MRIALVATLAFAALWFVALRPKPAPDSAAPAAAAAPQSAPGQAAERAREAVDASNGAAAERERAADAAGTEPSAPAADRGAAGPGPAIDVKGAPKSVSAPALRVLRDVVRGKVAVLLFWDRRLSDDRAVHRTVTGLDRRGGRVAVHVAPIRDLADYEPITRGVPVVTSPTVLVIDRAGRARSVGGLTVRDELDEIVGKALRVKP
jgi:hypothetical protein